MCMNVCICVFVVCLCVYITNVWLYESCASTGACIFECGQCLQIMHHHQSGIPSTIYKKTLWALIILPLLDKLSNNKIQLQNLLIYLL